MLTGLLKFKKVGGCVMNEKMSLAPCINAYTEWLKHYTFQMLYQKAMDSNGFAHESLVLEGEKYVSMTVICIVAPKNQLTDLIMEMVIPSDERNFCWKKDSLAEAVLKSFEAKRLIYTRIEEDDTDDTSAVIFASHSRELSQRLLSLCWCLSTSRNYLSGHPVRF
ncbi:MAG: hypothetical protein FWH21_00180 [Kiritimatiellaeota bacterium]|nr:hypothetical protein [Kiritimatiellota bacterium]